MFVDLLEKSHECGAEVVEVLVVFVYFFVCFFVGTVVSVVCVVSTRGEWSLAYQTEEVGESIGKTGDLSWSSGWSWNSW